MQCIGTGLLQNDGKLFSLGKRHALFSGTSFNGIKENADWKIPA